MKKLLIILFCLALFYSSCISENEQIYQKETIIQTDTLNVEKVKIATH